MSGSVLLVSQKVITLFLILFAGMIARKANIIDLAATKKLSVLLLNVTQPFMIITSFQIEFNAEKLKNGMAIFAFSVVLHVLTAAVAFLYFKPLKNNEPRKVYEMAMIFSNCAFLGYPVLKVVFGEELGVFYGTFYGIFFTVFIWTYGVYLISRKDKNNKDGEKFELPAFKIFKISKISKIFMNAGMISSVIGIIIFIFGIRLPGVLYDSSKMIGDMTFPLSMIIIGSLISDMKLKDMFLSLRNYYYVFLKLLLFPVVVAVICYMIKLPPLLIYVGTLMLAMPSGANVGIFAETYGADSKLAAICVGFSTLLSIGSIPLIMFFLSNVLKL